MLLGLVVSGFLFVLWFGIGALTAAVADNRGQNGLLWLLLGLVAPVLALRTLGLARRAGGRCWQLAEIGPGTVDT